MKIILEEIFMDVKVYNMNSNDGRKSAFRNSTMQIRH